MLTMEWFLPKVLLLPSSPPRYLLENFLTECVRQHLSLTSHHKHSVAPYVKYLQGGPEFSAKKVVACGVKEPNCTSEAAAKAESMLASHRRW
jgi:hypothetical protein